MRDQTTRTLKDAIRKISGQALGGMYVGEVRSIRYPEQDAQVYIEELESEVGALWFQSAPHPGTPVVVVQTTDSMEFLIIAIYEPIKTFLNGQDRSGILFETVLDEINKLKAAVDALYSVIRSSPIPEAGAGAPSAFQAALAAATLAITDTGLFNDRLVNPDVRH
jgi:hypothetical protein